MKNIHSGAFNETLADLLRELELTIDAMPPEAVRALPVELVDKARKFTEDEFRLDNVATVNSIGGYILNPMIRHLTANNFEFYIGTGKLYNTAKEQWDTNGNNFIDLVVRDTIKLPDGWDGRNGYAICRTLTSRRILRDTSFDTTAHRLNAKNLIIQNEKTIEVDFHQNYMGQDSAWLEFDKSKKKSFVNIDYILWRRKNV